MTKYLLLFVSIISLHFQGTAQDSGVSIEVHYPLGFEKNTNQYTDVSGIFGLGLQYQLTMNDKFNYGIEYRFDLNQTRKVYLGTPSTSFGFIINHLNLFSKINLDDYEKFKLYVAGGLSIYNYNKSSITSNFTGFNGSTGLSYEFVNRIYFFTNFSYIKAFLKQKQTGYVDSEIKQVIRFGVGFKI